MIDEFLGREEEEEMGKVINKRRVAVVDDVAELSLGPSLPVLATSAAAAESGDSSVSELFETNACRKRKHSWSEACTQTSVELQLNDPLPLDWEQCLDLQSGKMYYMDRKTLKKSSIRPKEEKLDLELNISTPPSSERSAASLLDQHYNKYYHNNNNKSTGNMVAAACLNCHLLVMLCKSSPSCPNCKYVHPLPSSSPSPPPRKVKSSETLSLLH